VSRVPVPILLTVALLSWGACGDEAPRRGATILFASGADLQSINPLLTNHPLARQVQRYVLLTTLARYDSLLVPRPYLARSWRRSPDGRTLTFRLRTDLHWHDGAPTTARDVVWTLQAARDPATGYPRFSELSNLTSVSAPDDSNRPICSLPTIARFMTVGSPHFAVAPDARSSRPATSCQARGPGADSQPHRTAATPSR